MIFQLYMNLYLFSAQEYQIVSIIQTPIKSDSSRAEKYLVKSKDTSSVYLPPPSKPIRCY